MYYNNNAGNDCQSYIFKDVHVLEHAITFYLLDILYRPFSVISASSMY